jgi:hypothetical protein
MEIRTGSMHQMILVQQIDEDSINALVTNLLE